jgi:hypothetical protein
MCRGWVLEHAKNELIKDRYTVKHVKIQGKLQDYVEWAFQRELSKIDMALSSYSAPGSNTFMKHLYWVAEDLHARECYVKTGWKSWKRKWKPKAQAKMEELQKKSST